MNPELINPLVLTQEQKKVIDDYIESIKDFYSHDNYENGKLTIEGNIRFEKKQENYWKLWEIMPYKQIAVIESITKLNSDFPLTNEEIYSNFTNITKVKIEEVTA